jgi:hypothetical protein
MITYDEAKLILADEYHRENLFCLLSDEVLPDFRKAEHPVSFQSDVFTSVTELGKSKICDIVIYEVSLKKGVQNRRIALTKAMFNIIRGQRVNNALVSFVNDDKAKYRLSLLTSKYLFSDNGEVVKTLSNPRRYTYSLGIGTKTKTAYDFLIKRGKVNSIEALIGRFSVEAVNRDFYDKIADCYKKLVKTDRRMFSIYNETLQSKYDEFAVRLIGRIMFCWFLKEKKSESGLALLPDELLCYFAVKSTPFYYHKILEPLFFEVLNAEVKNRKPEIKNEKLFNQIPYLNGGLFTPHTDDRYQYNDLQVCGKYGIITIDNLWFENFFKVLEDYNFTVDENSSYDIELSIDPEMLGRIFENLLAEFIRKETGSFYTPREIVDYMVDSTLTEYLKEKTKISEEKLNYLLTYSKVDNKIKFTDDEKKLIVSSLFDLKILDPACGSGAFPIGILQKVVFLLQEIDPSADLWFDKALENIGPLLRNEFQEKFTSGSLDYIRKLILINNSIHGVDIQPIAVEIARLRCFLSLIIDEAVNDDEANRGIHPLPNLEFKFVIANTLKRFESRTSAWDVEVREVIPKFEAVINEYFSAKPKQREILKKELKKLQDEIYKRASMNAEVQKNYLSLYSWEPFENKPADAFDYRWMFGVKEGFDIVIGNPPYKSSGLRDLKGMSAEETAFYKTNYPNSAEYKINLYAVFMEYAIRACKENGVSSLIVPDSFLLGRYFSKIRQYILDTCHINSLMLIKSQVFESATVGQSVVYLVKRTTNSTEKLKDMNIILVQSKGNISRHQYIINNYSQKYFTTIEHGRFRMFFTKPIYDIINKIDLRKPKLCKFFKGYSGIIAKGGKDSFISTQKIGKTYQPGIVSGSSVLRYCVVYEHYYINMSPELIKSGGNYDIISNDKILLRQTSDKLIAAMDYNGLYHLNNVHSFSPTNSTLSLQFVTAVLNSKLMNFYYKTISLEEGRAMAQIDIEMIEKLPIPEISEDNQKQFIDIVDKIYSFKKNNPSADVSDLENKIDRLIYEMYGLTEADVRLLEGEM